MNKLLMMTKLWSLLFGRLDENSWLVFPPEVAEKLAVAAMRTTEAFIGTKLAFRAHIIHLYSGKGYGGGIHEVGRSFPVSSSISV